MSECGFAWPLAPPVNDEDLAEERTHVCRRDEPHAPPHRCACGEEVEAVAVLDHPGTGFYIERLWAYVSVHADGDEGIIGATMGETFMPLVAADHARLESLRPWAQAAARASGRPVILARFDRRTDVETIGP